MSNVNTSMKSIRRVAGVAMSALLIVGLSGCGDNAPVTENPEATARIAPVGQLNTGAPMKAEAKPAAAPAEEAATAPATEAAAPAAAEPAAAPAARSGKEVYDTSCFICHATGAAGAPMLGNAEAWAPRIAAGMDAMMSTVFNGKGAMPPRGTCGNCSDDELRAAVEYMVESSK